MNRQQKEAIISDLKQQMMAAQATFLVNYKGLSVSLLQGLRKNLRSDGGTFKVTKATFMQRAAQDIAGADTFAELFKDQVGLVFASKDVPATAKHLATFAKNNEALKIIAGFYEAKLLSKSDLDFLASLPPKNVLIGQLLGTLQAPATNLVRLLNQVTTKLVCTVKEIEKQQAGKQ